MRGKNINWDFSTSSGKCTSKCTIAKNLPTNFFFKVWWHSRHSFYLFCIFLTRHTLIQYSSSDWSSPAGYLPELGINSCVWVNNSSCWAEGGVPGGIRTRGCRTAAQRTNDWATLHPLSYAAPKLSYAAPNWATLHPMSYAAPNWATLHPLSYAAPSELRCTLRSYAAPIELRCTRWATLHPLSYAAPYWATLHPKLSYAAPAELRCTHWATLHPLSYAAPCTNKISKETIFLFPGFISSTSFRGGGFINYKYRSTVFYTYVRFNDYP